MPSKNHGFIQSNIILGVGINYPDKFRLATEVSLALPTGERVPDVAIFNKIKYDGYNDEIRMTQMPLCAIEIISPKQGTQELIAKAKEYFEAGVLSYWLVIPGLDTVYVFSAATQHQVFSVHDILEDKQLNIKIDLAKIFI